MPTPTDYRELPGYESVLARVLSGAYDDFESATELGRVLEAFMLEHRIQDTPFNHVWLRELLLRDVMQNLKRVVN